MVFWRHHAQPAPLCFRCAGAGDGAASVARIHTGTLSRSTMVCLGHRGAVDMADICLRYQWLLDAMGQIGPVFRRGDHGMVRLVADIRPAAVAKLRYARSAQ